VAPAVKRGVTDEEGEMTRQSIPQKTVEMAWPLAAPEAFRGQIQDLMSETQKAMATFMSRYQEATTTGVRSFQALYACKDPAAFASAYGEWLTKSMTLMAEQMHDAQEGALRCAAIGRQVVSTAFRSPPEIGRAKLDSGAEASRARSAAE
jgi:hypothetical protein